MKPGDVIRHVRTGHPYLIVNQTDLCSFVIDLLSNETLHVVTTLLPKDYADFVPEKDLKSHEERWLGETYITWQKERPILWT